MKEEVFVQEIYIVFHWFGVFIFIRLPMFMCDLPAKINRRIAICVQVFIILIEYFYCCNNLNNNNNSYFFIAYYV